MIRLTYDQIKVLDRISEEVCADRLTKIWVAGGNVHELVVKTDTGRLFVIYPGGPHDEYLLREER